MIRAGIIGSTGYAGGELVRILLGLEDIIKERLNKEASIGFKADLYHKSNAFETAYAYT